MFYLKTRAKDRGYSENLDSLYYLFLITYGAAIVKGYFIFGPVVHQDMPDKDCTVVKKSKN